MLNFFEILNHSDQILSFLVFEQTLKQGGTVTTRKILNGISKRNRGKLHGISLENESFCVFGEIAYNLTKN